ncbi:MAG: aminopeptidase P family N-terminal domain-containing protein, partial [Pseudomonadota bacterium]
MTQPPVDSGVFPGSGAPARAKTLAKAKHPFADAEYQARLKNARQALDALGADSLMIFDGGNISYLCGYMGESSYVPQALVIDPRETFPNLYMRRQDEPAGMHFSFMPNDHVFGYPEALIGHPEKSPFSFIFDAVVAQGLTSVAMEFDSMSGETLKFVEAHYPNLRLVDASGLIHRLRLIKS